MNALRAALAALALILALPAATAQQPAELRNADPTAFGSVGLPVYTDAPDGDSVSLSVPLTVHPEALRAPAARYLFGFDLHDDAVRLSGVRLTMDGEDVPLEQDERGDPLQPRMVVAGDALPRDEPVDLVLSARASPSADGQVYVGVLAMAFDSNWGTLGTHDGGQALAYGFTFVMATGHAAHGLEPDFRGQGNSMLALAPLAALALLTLLGMRSAWRRLHPPAAKAPPPPPPAPAPPSSVSPPAMPPAPALAAKPPPRPTAYPVVVGQPLRPAPSPSRDFTVAQPRSR